MGIEWYVDIAYELLQEHTKMSFPKPSVVVGDAAIRERMPARSLKDLCRVPPEMMFEDSTWSIVVPSKHLPSSEDFEETMCSYALLHELSHALTMHVNPSLKEEVIHRYCAGSLAQRRKGYSLHALIEGVAEFLAIDSSRASGDRALRSLVDNHSDALKNNLQSWFDAYYQQFERVKWTLEHCSDKRIAKIILEGIGSIPPDGRTYVLSMLNREPGMICASNAQYLVGYDFVRRVGTEQLMLMRKPPVSFEELLYPETYASYGG